MFILFIVWKMVKSKLPTEFGLIYANGFHGGLFAFFLLGIVSFKPFTRVNHVIIRAIPYLVFFALAPYWHRTLPHNLVLDAPDFLANSWFANPYAMVVAISGTFAMIDMSRLLSATQITKLNFSMCFLGTASLGIYALHFYFLKYPPHVIAALLMSLLLYQLISLVPVARTLLLGK